MKKLQLAGRMRDALRSWVPAGLNIGLAHGDEMPLVERNGLICRCYRNWPEDREFLPRWNELLSRNPWATLFRGPTWQREVTDHFVPANQLRIITVENNDRMLALVPLAFSSAGFLETPGRWVTDYLDPLVDDEHTAQCWTIILELLEEVWDWSIGGVYLPHIRGDSTTRALLPQLCSRFGFSYEEEVLDQAPYISLPGSWEEYLAGMDSHERKEIKRKIRNAQTKANMKWTTLTHSGKIAPALERAMHFMRQSDGNKGDFTEEILIDFLRRITPQLAQSEDFFINELWLEGRPGAWLLGLRSARGPMWYNTAYDPELRNWSPGVVAFSLAIQDAIKAGHPIFNLLRGGEDYKKRLGATDLDLIKIFIRRA